MDTVKVFSPATVANVAAGFDIFGCALDTPGDQIHASFKKTSGVEISLITGDRGKLSKDPKKNVAGVVVEKLLESLGEKRGISLEVHKKMPLGSGLGSSSASSVGALFAVNELLGKPLEKAKLLPFALLGEKVACGSAHADNVAPALLGGFVLIRSYDPLDVIPIPVGIDLYFALLTPHVEILTRDARQLIPKKVDLSKLITQSANAAALVAGLMSGDASLISRSLEDVIVEPLRAPLIPCYHEIKEAALANGALGCNISGSGPSIFALSLAGNVQKIGQAMQKACTMPSDLHVSAINLQGPKVLDEA